MFSGWNDLDWGGMMSRVSVGREKGDWRDGRVCCVEGGGEVLSIGGLWKSWGFGG